MKLDELSESDKKELLFENQKKTLDKFLETGAITKEQYDKSLGTLKTHFGKTTCDSGNPVK